jgi:hypothetical protein
MKDYQLKLKSNESMLWVGPKRAIESPHKSPNPIYLKPSETGPQIKNIEKKG